MWFGHTHRYAHTVSNIITFITLLCLTDKTYVTVERTHFNIRRIAGVHQKHRGHHTF